MNDVKQFAVDRAIRALAAVGARYHVKYNGHVYASESRSEAKRPDFVGKFGYSSKMDSAKTGDVLTFQCEDKLERDRLQAAISAYGRYTRGLGGVTTHAKKDNSVEVLIMAPRVEKK